ncbi:hypothetical protein ACHAQK_008081, partial [Fusarium lateritium]
IRPSAPRGSTKSNMANRKGEAKISTLTTSILDASRPVINTWSVLDGAQMPGPATAPARPEASPRESRSHTTQATDTAAWRSLAATSTRSGSNGFDVAAAPKVIPMSFSDMYNPVPRPYRYLVL